MNQPANQIDHENCNSASENPPLTGESIETALINAKKWEVDNLQNVTPMNEIIRLFLGCDPGMVYRHDSMYRPPLMHNCLANIAPYIESEYRVRDDVVIDQLDNATNGDIPSWGFTRCRRGSSFIGSNALVMGGEIVTLSGAGYIFIEDRDGFRMIMYVSGIRRMGTEEHVAISLFASRERSDARVKLIRFLSGFESFCRKNKIYRKGAYDLDGNPIALERVSWDALKIPADLRRSIDTHICRYVTRLDDLRQEGIRPSRGIILAGKPGNGKTLLGRILATNMEIPLVWVTAQQMSSGYGSNNPIRRLYQFADMIAPVIILIEDADIFLENRNRNMHNSQLSELLNQIDGIRMSSGVITIITANNPELLDEAVGNRPKRFDVIIEFPNPGMEERLAILEEIAGKKTRPEDRRLLEDVARRLEGYSAAHVTEFAERLVMAVMFEGQDYINEMLVQRELPGFGFKQNGKSAPGFMLD